MGKYDRFIVSIGSFVIRHWLVIINVALIILIAPIVLTPYLLSTGDPALATVGSVFMRIYGPPVCHQLPDRSLFIFGHQMTVCARCFAIYVSFLAGGLLFYFLRNRLKPVHIIYWLLACAPMGIDGTVQLLGLPFPRGIGPGMQLIWSVESTNEIRIITGVLFGLASALYVMPYMQEIMAMEVEEGRKRIVEAADGKQRVNGG